MNDERTRQNVLEDTMINRVRSLIPVGLLLAGFAATQAAPASGPLPMLGAGSLSAQSAASIRNIRQQEEAAFLEARRAINAEEFARAAELLQEFRASLSAYASGSFIPDSYYWEAFARYRLGDLAEARLLLETLMIGFEEAQTGIGRYGRETGRLYNDARALDFEIRSQLAARGDADETADLLREAEAALDAESGFQVMPVEAAGRPLMLPVSLDDVAPPDSVPARMLAAAAAMGEAAPHADVVDSLMAAGHARADSLAWLHAQQDRPVPSAEESLARLAGALSFRQGDPQGAAYDQRSQAFDQRTQALTQWSQEYQEARRAQEQQACEDVSVQLAALEALMRFEVNRMQILRGVLGREDDCSMQLHDEVVELIAEEETDEAEAVLLGVVHDHPETSVRRAAVDELWRFNSYDAYLELRSQLDAADDATRRAAVDGLGISRYWATSPDWVRGALEDVAEAEEASLRLRQMAIYHLRRREEVDGSQLISLYEELLNWDDSDDAEDIREYLLDQLESKVRATSDEESADWAYALALDPSAPEGVRGEAFGAWTAAPSVNVAALAQLYRDFTEPFMRRHAIYAIYQRALSDRQVASTMIDLIRQENDPEVRERGIYWLGRTGAEEAVDFLLEFLPTSATDTIPPPPEGGAGRP